MNTKDLAGASPIATPPNFPVIWADPADANLYWVFDRMHWPASVTPMTSEYIDIFLFSADLVFRAWEIPVRMLSRRFNTYHYHTTAPLPLTEAEMAEQGQRTEVKLQEAMQRLEVQWSDSYLPEIQQHLQCWAEFDLVAASLPELLSHLDETIPRVRRLSEIHHIVQILASLGPSLFQDFYDDLFDDDEAPPGPAAAEKSWAAYRLLQGFDNKTLAGNRVLWQLSRQALALPLVRQALQDLAAPKVVATLEASTEGRDFLANLRGYLAAYGRRSAKNLELDATTWLEDPTLIMRLLQEYMTQSELDGAADLVAQAAERERLLAETRQHLHGYPQPVVDQFEALLKIAQVGIFLSEEHGYWIDQAMTYQVRQVMLEFGRRFAAVGVLDTVDDIFYLTFDEARATAAALPQLDQRRLVAGRRAELEYFQTIQPPPALGTVPPGPSPDDPFSRADLRFWGAPPLPSADPNLVHGNAGSPGRVCGPAKIVRSLAEAHKLQKGDILVAEATMPSWTPLFAIAAAVVTDTGGVLSHSAVVAREYGIPAVVGAGVATRTLHDGQMVEVDGSAGIVYIV